MSRFQAVFSPAQKDAAIRAAMVDDLSYAEVARRAAKGQLEGAGRFDIAPNYVGKLVRAARSQHDPAKLAQPEHAQAAITDARGRALSLLLRAFDAWEAKAKTGEFDAPEHQRLMRALREHEAGQLRRNGKHNAGGSDGDTPDAQEDAATLLAGLRTLAETGANARISERPSTASLSRQPAGQAEAPPLTAA